MKFNVLALAFLATAISASAVPVIHLPGTNDPDLRDPVKWQAKQREEIRKHVQVTNGLKAPAFAEAESDFTLLWNQSLRDTDAEAQNEYPHVIALADGNYLEAYTAGAGSLYYEGRLTKLDNEGKELWTATVQLGEYTTITQVCQDAAGDIYVAGLTIENGIFVPYVAQCSNGGEIGAKVRLSEGNVTVSIIALEGLEKGFAVVYSEGVYYWDPQTVTLSVRDNTGVEKATCSSMVNSSSGLYTSRLGDILLVPFYGNEAIFYNLADGTIALQETGTGTFQNGCATSDALYTVSIGWGTPIEISKYTVADGTVTKEWTSSSGLTAGYSNLYLFPVNDGRVLLHVIGMEYPSVAIMNTDGTIYKTASNLDFGSANNRNWVYSGGQLADGTIALFGMTYDTFKLSLMTLDADLSNPKCTVMPDFEVGYTYNYSYNGCSTFVDDKFLFSGYMRPETYWDYGYTPIFAALDPKTEEYDWQTYSEPGNIINIQPQFLAADASGNAYAMYVSGAASRLSKYGPEGELQWSNVIAEKLYSNYMPPVVLANGNIVTAAIATDLGLLVTCYDPEGEEVYSCNDRTIFAGYNMLGYPRGAEIDGSGDVVIAFTVYSEESVNPYILKVTADGKLAWKHNIPDWGQYSEPTNIVSDCDGNILVCGYSQDENYVASPAMAKIDADGNNIWCNVYTTDVSCPFTQLAVNADGVIYAVGNTGGHGALFALDTNGEIKGYDVYSTDSSFRTEYVGLVVDADGNAVVGSQYVGPSWNPVAALAIGFSPEGKRTWEKMVSSSTGGVYYANAIGLIDDMAVLLVNDSYEGCELAAFIKDEEIVATVSNLPEGEKLTDYLFCASAFNADRGYVFYTTSYGDMRFGNIDCIGNPNESVRKAQSIVWDQSFDEIGVGDSVELNATATSGLAVSYQIVSGAEFVTLAGNTLTIVAGGPVKIKASQDGDDVWAAASPVFKAINIESSIETIETDTAAAVYFNLQGQRVYTPALIPGVYIKVQGNDRTKVIVK